MTMAHFICDRYPSLLVAGVGKFVNGNLTADGEDAELVRKLTKKLGIEEVNAPPDDSKTDEPTKPADGDPQPTGDGPDAATGDEGETDEEQAGKGDDGELDPPEPKGNARRAEVEEWAAAHGFDIEDDLKGKTVPEIREAVHAKYAPAGD